MPIDNNAAQQVIAQIKKLDRLESTVDGDMEVEADGEFLRRDDVISLITSMLSDAQLLRVTGENLNGGMHASIFIKVWGDAGGGDAGRCALAEYAYDLGVKDTIAKK